jgi:hypothetical protein
VPFPFLSDDWIEAARTIRDELEAASGAEVVVPDAVADLRINLVVEDVPFGQGVVNAHLDTTRGGIDIEVGHLDEPQATVTLDYATARSFLVDQDQSTIMQAFLGGRLSVDGDVTRLLVLAGQPPPPDGGDELAVRVRAITS